MERRSAIQHDSMSRKAILCVVVVMCMIFGVVHPVKATSHSETHDYQDHWAKETIDKWVRLGQVTGFPDGSMRPDQPITRAELMSFTNRAFGFTDEAEITFRDVEEAAWYASDVKRAVAAAYVQGYADRTVRPLAEVSRQEAAVMIQSVLSLEPEPAAAARFEDQASIANWGRGAIGAVLSNGIISGYPDGRLLPERALTRAEAMAILDRAHALWTADQNILLDEAGQTFGPDNGSKRIMGNIFVGAPDTKLQHLVIDGDLVIRESVGNGDVHLNEVEVKGTVMVYGGGSDSVHIHDSTVYRLWIEKEGGRVRIVASGATSITETEVYSPVLLEEADQLEGEGFQHVNLFGSEMDIRIIQAIIDRLHVMAEVTEAVIYLEKDAVILELINDGKAEVIEVGSSSSSGSSGSGSGGSGGSGSDSTPAPTVTAVTYSPESLSLTGIGQKIQVQVTAQWSDSTSSDVTVDAIWNSEDEAVAVVHQGEVTAAGAGTTFIVAKYGSFEIRVPVSVVAEASYALITPGSHSTVAGEAVTVTMAVYRSDGSLDTEFDGGKRIAVSGYTFAPDGTAGSILGVPLTEASTIVTLPFTGGVASADLILHHAQAQSLSINIEEIGDPAHTWKMTPSAGEVSHFKWVQRPSLSAITDVGLVDQPILQLTDPYLNPINVGTVQAEIRDSDYRLSGTATISVVDGMAIFTDLTIQSLGSGTVTLHFTTDVAGGAHTLESDPIAVQGEFTTGDGSAAAPYEVTGATQLAKMREDVSAHYVLSNDIELSNDLEFYEDMMGWVPIGTSSSPFTGTFDGNGHTISDLRISRDNFYQGLFGVVDGGTITHLHLSNVEVWNASSFYAGALAGLVRSGEVSHVSATGIVIGGWHIGGLIGQNNGTVSYASFISTGADHRVQGEMLIGGLFGTNYGEVTHSFANVKVIGEDTTGGLIGENNGKVIQSYAEGDIAPPPMYTYNQGGLIGLNGESGIVEHAYATGNVSGTFSIGGLIGKNYGKVANTYAAGRSPTGGSDNGGLVGENEADIADIISSYYYQGKTNGVGERKTEAQMKQRATYTGWVFEGDGGEEIWRILEDVSFPTFIFE